MPDVGTVPRFSAKYAYIERFLWFYEAYCERDSLPRDQTTAAKHVSCAVKYRSESTAAAVMLCLRIVRPASTRTDMLCNRAQPAKCQRTSQQDLLVILAWGDDKRRSRGRWRKQVTILQRYHHVLRAQFRCEVILKSAVVFRRRSKQKAGTRDTVNH